MKRVKRHIVHAVRSDSFAGVERYICDVSAEFARRGWCVTVIGGNASRMRRGLPPDVTHHRATTTAAVAARLAMIRHPTLVHAHMTAAEVACVAVAAPRQIPVVATRHFARQRGNHRFTQMVARRVAKRLAREIAISEFVARSLTESVTVLLNGVPPTRVASPAENKVVLCAQRLESEKQTAVALHAWARAGLRKRGWVMVIAGRGAEAATLRDLATELAIDESVEFAGFVDDLDELRSRSGIFLATAPAEPFGLAVVEAMAAGLPVVAADGGAHRETLGDTGRYFKIGDAFECAGFLDDLGGNPEGRARLGLRTFERYQAELSITRHVDRLVTIYEAALT